MAAAPTGGAHALLARLAADVLGGPPPRVGHACAHCGSGDHGAPTLPETGLFASLTRADGLDVVACTDAAPIGVDAERAGVAGPEVAPVVLHPAESPADPTRTWVRKEAVLKATGRGLLDDPRGIRLTGPHETARVVEGPDVSLADVDLGPRLGARWVCAVAVAGAGRVIDVRVRGLDDVTGREVQ